MDTFVIFTFVGLSTSAIYAVIASGLVLTYTTTGVFNVAHGAAGMLSAYVYWQLHVAWGLPALLSAAVVLAVFAPLLGLFLERVIMRALTGTSEATKLVVSISLLVAMIGLAQAVWAPDVARRVPPFFGLEAVSLGGVNITYHQIFTLLAAGAAVYALRLLLTRTRVGVAMRAVVDDRNLTLLNGVRTDRVAQLSWVVSTCLAALGGILIVSSAGLNAATLSLLIVNAYAAAVFGRLRSLPMTFVGALVIGLGDGYLAAYLPSAPHLAGLRSAFPVLVLFVVLLVLPSRQLRTSVRTREYFPAPTLRGGWTYLALVTAFGVVLATTLSPADTTVFAKIFSIGIIALSLVPLVGFAGQISLCQLSLAGIGAAVAAQVAGGSLWGLLVAMVVAAAVGGLVALPSLRLSGIYLALATLSFAVVLDRWLFNLPPVLGFALFPNGDVNVEPLSVAGFVFDTPRRQMLLSVGCFVAVSALVIAIRRSRYGRRLLALRDSEAACATFGLNLIGARLSVFMLSAALAGLGGALYGMQVTILVPGDFQLVTGLPIFMLVVAGGAGFVSAGLFVGVALYGLLPLAHNVKGLGLIGPILPGLTGIALGRTPSGAAPDISHAFAPLKADRLLLRLTLGGCALAYAGRLMGLWGNPRMWQLILAVGFVGLVVATRRAMPAPEGPEPTALEWVGVTEPWTEDRVREVEQVVRLIPVQEELKEQARASS